MARFWKIFFICFLLVAFICCKSPKKSIMQIGDKEIEITYPYTSFNSSYTIDQKIDITDYPVKILENLQKLSNDTIYSCILDKNSKKCRVVSLSNSDSHIDTAALLNSLSQFFNVKEKINIEPTYILDLKNFNFNNDNDVILCSADILLNNIRSICKENVCLTNISDTNLYKIPQKILTKHNINDMIIFLNDSCNIKLSTSDSIFCTKITYYIE